MAEAQSRTRELAERLRSKHPYLETQNDPKDPMGPGRLYKRLVDGRVSSKDLNALQQAERLAQERADLQPINRPYELTRRTLALQSLGGNPSNPWALGRAESRLEPGEIHAVREQAAAKRAWYEDGVQLAQSLQAAVKDQLAAQGRWPPSRNA